MGAKGVKKFRQYRIIDLFDQAEKEQSARRGRLRPYGAVRRGNTGARHHGADEPGDRADRTVLWRAHTRGGRVHSVEDACADGLTFGVVERVHGFVLLAIAA